MKIKYRNYLTKYARQLRQNQTKSEERLWNELRNKKVLGYRFLRQKPIDKFIVDFYCPKLKLVIELDGYSHQFDEITEKDEMKESKLREVGLSILRFQDHEVLNDLDNVLREIIGFIEESEKN